MSDDIVKVLGWLAPGRTYVIQSKQRLTQAGLEAIEAHLHARAPECKFIILDSGMELVGSIPETEL